MTGEALAPPVTGHTRAALQAASMQWRAAPVPSALLVVLTVVTGSAPTAAAWLTKQLIDGLGDGTLTRSAAISLAMGIAGAGAASIVLLHAAHYVGERVRYRTAAYAEEELFRRVCRLRGLDRMENPDFHNRLTIADEATQEAPEAVAGLVQDGLRSLVAIGTFAATLAVVWPPMIAIVLACAVPTLAARILVARRESTVAEVMAATVRRRALYRALLTDVRAAKEIRLFGLGDVLRDRMGRAIARSAEARLSTLARGARIQSALAVLTAVAVGAGTWLVVAGAAEGRHSVGDIALFFAAVAGVQAAVVSLVLYAGEAVRSVRLFRHYVDIVRLPDETVDDAPAVPALVKGVQFRDVWFRYGDGPWVLCGLDLWLPAGRTVGLVGLNGAGKSTLVKLLCRFYEPSAGEILWDGVDIRSFDVATLRARIGVMFQDFMTYELTVTDNIGFGDPRRIDDEELVRRAASMAGAHHAIEALPAGYRTQLSRTFHGSDGGAGTTLSGGQWQRLALARTLFRAAPDIVVLDEPTSGLDAEAEQTVTRTVAAMAGGRMCIVISHRLSMLRHADVVVALVGGTAVERGTHDELMALDGSYARLFRLQASAYRDVERAA